MGWRARQSLIAASAAIVLGLVQSFTFAQDETGGPGIFLWVGTGVGDPSRIPAPTSDLSTPSNWSNQDTTLHDLPTPIDSVTIGLISDNLNLTGDLNYGSLNISGTQDHQYLVSLTGSVTVTNVFNGYYADISGPISVTGDATNGGTATFYDSTFGNSLSAPCLTAGDMVFNGAVTLTAMGASSGFFSTYNFDSEQATAGTSVNFGSGSSLKCDGSINVNFSMPLLLNGGAQASCNGDHYNDGDSQDASPPAVALMVNSESTMTIDGSGTDLKANGNFIAGTVAPYSYETSDNSTIKITNGGELDVTGTTQLGSKDFPSSDSTGNTAPAGADLTVDGTGSKFEAADVLIGNVSGVSSSVTVSNNGTLHSTGTVTVGATDGGNGELKVTSGGVAYVDGDLIVSAEQGSAGTVSIDGTNSGLQVQGNLIIGQGDAATFSMSNGAELILGSGGGVASAAKLAAAGSIMPAGTLTDDMIIDHGAATFSNATVFGGGYAVIVGKNTGSNSLMIENGSTVTGLASINISEPNDVSNNVTVTGKGTSVQANNFYVGGSGNGELDVTSGAELLVSPGGGLTGGFSGGFGTINLDDATIDCSGSGSFTAYIGGNSPAQLSITNGGEMKNVLMKIGPSGVNSSTVTISGSESALLARELNIGDGHTGAVTVEDGASVGVDLDLNMGGDPTDRLSGGTGTLTVTGAGSEVNTEGGLFANYGTETISVTNAGSLDTLYLDVENPKSSLIVSDPSTVVAANSGVRIANNATASISNSAIMKADTETDSYDEIDQGTMTINSGASVSSPDFQIHTAGPNGAELSMSEVGSSVSVSTMEIGGTTSASDTAADSTVMVANFANLYISNSLMIDPRGELNLSQAGAVTVGTGNTAALNELVVHKNASITNYGEIVLDSKSDLVIEQGAQEINAGRIVVGRLINDGDLVDGADPVSDEIDGNLDVGATGVLDVPIFGADPSEYNHMTVTGDTTIEGKVVLDFQDGFAPTTGETFDLFTFDGATPALTNVEVDGLEPGWQYEFGTQNGDVVLESLSDAVPTPEPAAVMLLAAMSPMMLRRKRGAGVGGGSSLESRVL